MQYLFTILYVKHEYRSNFLIFHHSYFLFHLTFAANYYHMNYHRNYYLFKLHYLPYLTHSISFSVTIHVHQRDVTAELAALAKNKRITDANDFEWLKQARFYWRDGIADEISPDG